MIPQLLKHLIRMQNPLQDFDRKGDASSRPGFTGVRAGALSHGLERSSTKASDPGIRAPLGSGSASVEVARTDLQVSTGSVPASRPETPAYEGVRIDVDLLPSLSEAPEILFFEEKISEKERREKQRRGSHLPFLTVRWQESVLVFRANDTDFRRMSLEWNGPLLEEGKAFFELLLRLKEYGIEEIYRNGRLISMERQA